jgi:hypothetical protein
MQLPRGTFREIKKYEAIESILAELERTRFSGICSISSGPATGTLVFNRGKCILIKFQGKSGDAGWDEMQKSIAVEVDAALSSLDDAQVQLALEFNKACKIVKAGRTGPQPQRPAPPQRQEAVRHEPVRKPAAAHPTTPPPPPVKAPPKPAAPAVTATVPPPRPPAPRKAPPPVRADSRAEAPRQASQIPPAPRAPAQRAEEAKGVPEEELPASGQGSFEKDIDTFDSLDLENVTDKIRNDCKTMIKQLHLEHLMER